MVTAAAGAMLPWCWWTYLHMYNFFRFLPPMRRFTIARVTVTAVNMVVTMPMSNHRKALDRSGTDPNKTTATNKSSG